MSSSREIESAQNEIGELLQGEEFNTEKGRNYLLELLYNFLDSLDNRYNLDFFKTISSLPEFNQLEKLHHFLTHPNKEIQFETAIRIGLAYLSQSEAGRFITTNYRNAVASTNKKEMLLTDLERLHEDELYVVFCLLSLSGITSITLDMSNEITSARMSLLAEWVKDNLITKIKLDGGLSDRKIDYVPIYDLFMDNNSLASDLDLIGIGSPAQAQFTGLYLMIKHSNSLSSLAISLAGLNDDHLEKLGTSLENSKIETLTIAQIDHLSSVQFIKLLDYIKESAISHLEILASEVHHLDKEIYNLCQSITTKSGEKLVRFIEPSPNTQQPNTAAVSNMIMKINYYMKKRANETYSFTILTWLFGYSGKDYYERRASWKNILDQLSKIDPSNEHSLKSVINTINDAIKQFGNKGRSEYANKLEKLKKQLLSSSNAVKNINLGNYISTSYKIYNALDIISHDTKAILESQRASTNILQSSAYLEYSLYQSNLPEFLNIEEVNETERNNTLRY